jgi:hypothetical protein
MAKIPRQPSSHKRLHNTGIAATPLRRSRRIAYREPFRFNDLPPELRNMIYRMLLRHEDERFLALVDDRQDTAKALSQVSRTIRTESLSVYYSENDFAETFQYWRTPLGTQHKVADVEEWFAIFGKLAAQHIRSLSILHLDIYAHEGQHLVFSLRPPDLLSTFPRLDAFHEEMRALFLARIVRQSNHPHWARGPKDHKMSSYPIGLFRALGKLRLQPEALRLLLTSLHLAAPNATRSDPALVAAALLEQLE